MTGRPADRTRGLSMEHCVFVSDLHGRLDRYEKLFQLIAHDEPEAVFIGGDFLPSGLAAGTADESGFITGYMREMLGDLRRSMGESYPRMLLIMGNDDERAREPEVRRLESAGLLEYIHCRSVRLGLFRVYGCAFVPPTPFLLKDWERYDVSRYVDPGCIPPEEGKYSFPVSPQEVRFTTIQDELGRLAGAGPMGDAIFLFHAPPYDTRVDVADIREVMFEGVPLDRHVGSIAIRRFIEERQPLLTLHGHVHPSAVHSGTWRDRIGRTHVFSAAHDGCETAVVCFNPANPSAAIRRLL